MSGLGAGVGVGGLASFDRLGTNGVQGCEVEGDEGGALGGGAGDEEGSAGGGAEGSDVGVGGVEAGEGAGVQVEAGEAPGAADAVGADDGVGVDEGVGGGAELPEGFGELGVRGGNSPPAPSLLRRGSGQACGARGSLNRLAGCVAGQVVTRGSMKPALQR